MIKVKYPSQTYVKGLKIYACENHINRKKWVKET